MSACVVVIEGDGDSYSGYAPDLPRCIAAGDSADEVRELMHEAIPLHIESLRSHGESVPPPLTQVEYVELSEGASAGKLVAPRSTGTVALATSPHSLRLHAIYAPQLVSSNEEPVQQIQEPNDRYHEIGIENRTQRQPSK